MENPIAYVVVQVLVAVVFWPAAYLMSSWLLPILSLGVLRVLPIGSSRTLKESWSFRRLSKFRIGVGPGLACYIGAALWVLIVAAIVTIVSWK